MPKSYLQGKNHCMKFGNGSLCQEFRRKLFSEWNSTYNYLKVISVAINGALH